MASLNREPYPLTSEKIDEVVKRTSAGKYVLGCKDAATGLLNVPHYVGRADKDVNARLKEWVGRKPDRYTHFWFSYAKDSKAAFEKECKNYHDLGEKEKLDNKHHPERPDKANWKCPRCNIFD